MNSFKDAFTEDSFYLKFQPLIDKKGRWNGDVDISAIIHDDHGLNNEDLSSMLYILNMVCASVPLFEEDDESREKAIAIVEAAMQGPYTEYVFGQNEETAETVKKPSVTTEGNVITLRFGND